MIESAFSVEVTDTFLQRLRSIEQFLLDMGATDAHYDRLLIHLRSTVLPNLAAFPGVGRSYLDDPPQSVEALNQLQALPQGLLEELREYLFDDYLLLYVVVETSRTVFLLSIRHHKELTFR